MVASRKPKARTGARKRETLDEMFERLMAQPPGTRNTLTKRQAVYVLKRLAGSDPDPNRLSGDEVVKRFYGLWPDREDGTYPD